MSAAASAAGPARAPELVVHTRAGCPMCVEAERAAWRLADRARVRVVDVDDDPALARAYGDRVPVVTIDGQETLSLLVDEASLAAALATHRAP